MVRIILKKTGIIYYRLLRQEDKTTFLLFYKTQLAYHLQDPDVLCILKANGYKDLSLSGILRTFQCRFETYMNQGEGVPMRWDFSLVIQQKQRKLFSTLMKLSKKNGFCYWQKENESVTSLRCIEINI